MHIHILGICGTFMGGLAQLAKQAGHSVSGSDENVYPPMSIQLQQAGIELYEGYHARDLNPATDCVVVGNVMSRGNPLIEEVLNRDIAYISGPQWLSNHLLRERWVLAVAGTHGKTSGSSMLAWVLEYAGLKPGFLIGGVPENFGVSARLGESPFFVIEADEYDTAFFDKRSKFLHYRPRTLILNNLEFDHADIFADLAAIQRQFHHLIRIVPGEGMIVCNGDDANLQAVLDMGCWTPVQQFSLSQNARQWSARSLSRDGSGFELIYQGTPLGQCDWSQLGMHNVSNALAVIAAARHVGVPVEQSLAALAEFKGVKRRMEVRGQRRGITVYDDFAHHPTAIATTVAGLRARIGGQRLVAVLEPRSNTMRMGVHKAALANSLAQADEVILFEPDNMEWSVAEALQDRARIFNSVADIIADLLQSLSPGDHVLIMSNGSFGGIHDKLLAALE